MKRLFCYLQKVNRKLLAIFLASNLLLISTGSAELLSTPSADLQEASVAAVVSSSTPTPAPIEIAPDLTTLKSSTKRIKKIDSAKRIVEDEIIVKFKNGTSDEKKAELLKSKKADVYKFESESNKNMLLKVDPAKREEIIRELLQDPNVEYAENNGEIRGTGYFGGGGVPLPGGGTPQVNDPYYGSQWNLSRSLFPIVWNSYKGSSTVKVAIVDSGVNYDLLEFEGRVIKGKDFVDEDDDPMDENDHGTAVASVFGAVVNNNRSIAGADWYAKILAVRVTDENGGGNVYDLIDGLNYIYTYHSNVRVVNLSIQGFDDYASLRQIIEMLQGQGMIIVAATPNTDTHSCFMYFPAAYSGVIVAHATDNSNNWRAGCSYNWYYDAQGNIKKYNGQYILSAPGHNIFVVKKDGSVDGTWTGTSLAAPLISAAFSILRGCNSDLIRVRRAIIDSADDVGLAGWDYTYGFGVLNVSNAKANLGC